MSGQQFLDSGKIVSYRHSSYSHSHSLKNEQEIFMAGRLDGELALITGAAWGQGKAQMSIQEGTQVMLTDMLDDLGQKAAQILEIAYGVLHWASKESSFVTGTELIVDSGFTGQ